MLYFNNIKIMKTSLLHIPENKQTELEKIVEVIKSATVNNIKSEMILLYWSYARWDFVEKDIVREWNNTLEYKSDFDILVITRKPTQEKNTRLQREIENKINSDKTIHSPVSIIVEDIHHINARLWENRYFYLDIKREWVELYNSWKVKLWEARVLLEKEKNKIQKEDFKVWFKWANNFLDYYYLAYKNNNLNDWAFLLHQISEKLITSYLLVKTGYKPKTHDLEILYKKIKELNILFNSWFNLEDWKESEKDYFELLRKGYVDGRYSKNYKITKKELKFLEKKILYLRDLVEKLCMEEILKNNKK